MQHGAEGRAPGRWAVGGVLLLVIVAWGAAFSGIKVLLRSLTPAALTSSRLLVAAVVFTALALATGRGRRTDRRPGDLWRLVALGAAGFAGYHLAINSGERLVSAGVASLVVASMPVMVAALAAVLLGEALGPRGILGIAIAFGGVTLLAGSAEGFAVERAAGVGITLLAPVSWATYTVISKPLAARYDGVRLNLLGAWIGAVLVLPLAWSDMGAVADLSWSDWAWLLFLGGVCTALAYVVYGWALRHLPASVVAAYVYLVPVSALTWAWILLGEVPGPAAIGGGLLVVAGVLLVQRRRVREPETAPIP